MIVLANDTERSLRYQCEKAFPEEACGALLGSVRDRIRVVHDVLEIHNSRGEDRGERYLITPAQYLQAEREAHGRNLELIGFYHSHINHDPSPSPYDLEHALPWFAYIIVSVLGGRSERIAGWLLDPHRTRFDGMSIEVRQ